MQTEIVALLTSDEAWQQKENTLVGTWEFTDFSELRSAVVKLLDLADTLDHHPTVTYGYNALQIETTTHDAGNTITQKDIDLARAASQLLETK